jgi:hypothetical protein
MVFQKFCDLFSSVFEAGEFESAVLSIGREFLPACALTVLDGGESTEEYWAFLASQIKEDAIEIA